MVHGVVGEVVVMVGELVWEVEVMEKVVQVVEVVEVVLDLMDSIIWRYYSWWC